MPRRRNRLGRTVVILFGLLVALAGGGALFVQFPTDLADIVGILLAIAVAGIGLRVAGRLAERVFPSYNVAEVAVEGPISRDGRGLLPSTPNSTPADDIVEQIEAADDDPNAEALLVKLNTPGGEVGASDDIRAAAREFDGPSIAYATDLCASGGYWIASGCDERWARDHTLVGSIGVIMSRVNASELAEKLGLSYEPFTAGAYKDAGTPLKELTDDERDYLQGLTDGYYEDFIERVSAGLNLQADEIRDTEARLYLGDAALELGLVNALGRRDDVVDALEDRLGTPVTVREFEPERGLRQRLRGTAVELAYAFGAGAAGAVAGDREPGLELR